MILGDYDRFAVKNGVIYDAIRGHLNIQFASESDAELCCKLLNQMNRDYHKLVVDIDEVFNWHKEHYGKSVLDERMEFKSPCEIENEVLKKENEQLKQELFETEKDYILETYDDNPVRRDDKLISLKREFKERFGRDFK